MAGRAVPDCEAWKDDLVVIEAEFAAAAELDAHCDHRCDPCNGRLWNLLAVDGRVGGKRQAVEPQDEGVRGSRTTLAEGMRYLSVVASVLGFTAVAAAQGVSHFEVGHLAPVSRSHTFEALEGQEVVVEVRSEEFDTLLTVRAPTGEEFENDDFDDTNSQVTFSAGETGTYEVVVESFSGGRCDRTFQSGSAPSLWAQGPGR